MISLSSIFLTNVMNERLKNHLPAKRGFPGSNKSTFSNGNQMVCQLKMMMHLYNHSVSQYFKPGADKTELEKRIEFLKYALETLDFSSLRSRYPQFGGNHECDVAYAADDRGQTVILIEGKQVEVF